MKKLLLIVLFVSFACISKADNVLPQTPGKIGTRAQLRVNPIIPPSLEQLKGSLALLEKQEVLPKYKASIEQQISQTKALIAEMEKNQINR